MSAESKTGLVGWWVRRLAVHSALGAQIAALLVLAGCVIPHVPSRTIYEDPVNYVRLDEDPAVLPEWPPSFHSHPAAMGPERLRAILSGLKVQEHRGPVQRWIQGEAPVMSVFKEEDLAWLVPQMAEALAQAKPNERVTFYLSEPQTSTKRIITSGGLYVRGSELHLVLGNWQVIYGIPTYGMIYDRRYPMRPTAAKGFDLFFQPFEAMIPQHSSVLDDLLANGKDELVLDLSKIAVDAPVRVPAASPVS